MSKNRLGENGVGALAASPRLAGLRWLGLERVEVGDAGAQALAKSPHLERLEVLDLRDNGELRPQTLEALRQRFGVRVHL
jgi:hypothetical protein